MKDEEETTEISDGYVTIALGNTWSHNVNTRLILQYLVGEKRQVSFKLQQSRIRVILELEYFITIGRFKTTKVLCMMLDIFSNVFLCISHGNY